MARLRAADVPRRQPAQAPGWNLCALGMRPAGGAGAEVRGTPAEEGMMRWCRDAAVALLLLVWVVASRLLFPRDWDRED